jgi:glycosyltransferase involved in cell wall biosynthesis
MAILLISPEPWDAHAVSKHHYARTLASEGHRVLFLDPPEPGRQLTLEPIPEHPGVERVQGPRVAPGLQRMPGRLRRWLEHRWLRRLERLAGCRIEVIWLFENSRFFDLRFAGSRLKIYHQVDLNQNFHPAIAAETADICFCTSELIRQRLLPHNTRSYRLQHGFALVNEPIELTKSEQQRFSCRQLQAMYVGNLEMAYLDFELLALMVRKHPEVVFHFVGGYSQQGALRRQLEGQLNVHWWGKVSSAVIPSLLEQSDVLMVCYQESHHQDQSNPHKIMEYLASGRTVVATYTEEYKQHRDLLAMSEPGSNAGYPKLFATVLSQLSAYNCAERMEARRAFAADHTYPKQLARIQRLLREQGLISCQMRDLSSVE